MAATIAFNAVKAPARLSRQFSLPSRRSYPLLAGLHLRQSVPARHSSSSSGSGIRAQSVAVEPLSEATAVKVEADVVIVIGASRGIGKAVALALGKSGFHPHEHDVCALHIREAEQSKRVLSSSSRPSN